MGEKNLWVDAETHRQFKIFAARLGITMREAAKLALEALQRDAAREEVQPEPQPATH